MDPGSDPAAARHQARTILHEAGWTPDRIEDACLVVSELVTNAILHGGGSARLRLDLDDERLHIQVEDHNHQLPRRRPSPSTQLHGRGLWIVDALSESWGSEIDPSGADGKLVWATLSRRSP
jgi:anti-sigma regulatory factor (Ser/Thr protein kinase)